MATSGQDSPLAARLRRARQAAGLTQRDVAIALGVSIAGVSSWESRDAAKVPDTHRLEKYAAFLAERLDVDAAGITGELLALREGARKRARTARAGAVGARGTVSDAVEDDGGIWSFHTRLPITIICSRTPEAMLAGLDWARPTHPNYVRMWGMAEVDAALSLNAYLRMHNPSVDVHIGTTDELRSTLLTGHVVVLGRLDWPTVGGPMLQRLGIPVGIRAADGGESAGEFDAVITTDDGRSWAPRLQEVASEEAPVLLDDVALLARGPSPLNSSATVTVCTGMFNRGTTGLVRATTDRYLARANHEVLAARFGAGGATRESFALVARVNVVDQVTPPVDLSVPGVLEWSWTREASA